MPSGSSFDFSEMRIGMDYRKKMPFEGCMRDFKMVNSYLTDSQIEAISYTSLYPSSMTLFNINLRNSTLSSHDTNRAYLNLPSNTQAEILGKEEHLTQIFDFSPVHDCIVAGETTSLLEFGYEKYIEMERYLDEYPTESTISIWFYR
jgi:hypothetical protein